jgi:Universal stress protein family
LQNPRGEEGPPPAERQGAKTMSRSRLILHPSDFSPASRPALAQAIAAAKAQRAQLLVVHVLATSIPMLADGYVSPRIYDDLIKSEQAPGPTASEHARGRRQEGRRTSNGPPAGRRCVGADRARCSRAARRHDRHGNSRSHGAGKALPGERSRTRRGQRAVPGHDGQSQAVSGAVEMVDERIGPASDR